MRLTVLALLLMYSICGFAQPTRGIHFEESDWATVLHKAKLENKLIFLDAYTSWCTPCKEMNRNVFTSKRLGDFYNQNFISVKMDMEQGFGPALAIRYGIRMFPTELFINGDGTLVHLATGFQNIDRLVSLGHAALDPNKQMSAWTQRYMDGDRHEDFMANYFMAHYKRNDGSYKPLVDEYFISQKNWGSDINVRLLFEFVVDASDPKFDYLIENRSRFNEVVGTDVVTNKVEQFVDQRLFHDIPQPSLLEAEVLMLKVYPNDGAKRYSTYRLNRHFDQEEYDLYADAMISHMKTYPTRDPVVLNSCAKLFYEYVQDEKKLNSALSWAKKASGISSSQESYYNVSAIYYKLDNKRKAKKFAKKSIKVAKKSGHYVTQSLELMERIKSM